MKPTLPAPCLLELHNFKVLRADGFVQTKVKLA